MLVWPAKPKVLFSPLHIHHTNMNIARAVLSSHLVTSLVPNLIQLFIATALLFGKKKKLDERLGTRLLCLIPLIDDFQFPILQKVAHLTPPCQDGGHQLTLDLLLLLLREGLVPLLQSHLALPAEQQHVLDLFSSWGGGGGGEGNIAYFKSPSTITQRICLMLISGICFVVGGGGGRWATPPISSLPVLSLKEYVSC